MKFAQVQSYGIQEIGIHKIIVVAIEEQDNNFLDKDAAAIERYPYVILSEGRIEQQTRHAFRTWISKPEFQFPHTERIRELGEDGYVLLDKQLSLYEELSHFLSRLSVYERAFHPNRGDEVASVLLSRDELSLLTFLNLKRRIIKMVGSERYNEVMCEAVIEARALLDLLLDSPSLLNQDIAMVHLMRYLLNTEALVHSAAAASVIEALDGQIPLASTETLPDSHVLIEIWTRLKPEELWKKLEQVRRSMQATAQRTTEIAAEATPAQAAPGVTWTIRDFRNGIVLIGETGVSSAFDRINQELKERWLDMYAKYKDFFPKQILAVWPFLEKADPEKFNHYLALGVRPIHFTIEQLEQVAEVLATVSEKWGQILTPDNIALLRKACEDVMRAEEIYVEQENKRREPEEYIKAEPLADIGELNWHVDSIRYEKILNYTPGEISRIKDILREIELMRTIPIFSLLSADTRSQLPTELREFLEDCFFQWYGSYATGLSDMQKYAYIYPDSANPKGSITDARNIELQVLYEYGFDHERGEEEYIEFLELISRAVNQSPDGRFEFTIGSEKYIVVLGAGFSHYDQEIPFTNQVSPDEEPNDIGVYRWIDGEYKLQAIIPSSWKMLARDYRFYEYNGTFAFGPKVLLPVFIDAKTPQERYEALQVIKKQLETLAGSRATAPVVEAAPGAPVLISAPIRPDAIQSALGDGSSLSRVLSVFALGGAFEGIEELEVNTNASQTEARITDKKLIFSVTDPSPPLKDVILAVTKALPQLNLTKMLLDVKNTQPELLTEELINTFTGVILIKSISDIMKEEGRARDTSLAVSALQYCATRGFRALLYLLAHLVTKETSIPVNPNTDILIADGIESVLDNIGIILLNKGDTVIYQSNIREDEITQYKQFEPKLEPLDLAKAEARSKLKERLARGENIKIIHVLLKTKDGEYSLDNTAQRELLELAKQYGLIIVEDARYAPAIPQQDERENSLKAKDGEHQDSHVLQIRSFELFSGILPLRCLKLAYVLSPDYLAVKLEAKKAASTLHPNAFGQAIIFKLLLDTLFEGDIKNIPKVEAEFITDQQLAEWLTQSGLEEKLTAYGKRVVLNIIRDILKNVTGDVISFAGGIPDPTLFPFDFIVDVMENLTQEQLNQILKGDSPI
ncbi:MAG: hypothetical protein FJZ16_07655, partial [Candidatus Omnitrophica bacterium]|nr:hypothetical protein [Candidatus Omnitrophota bacterium]